MKTLKISDETRGKLTASLGILMAQTGARGYFGCNQRHSEKLEKTLAYFLKARKPCAAY